MVFDETRGWRGHLMRRLLLVSLASFTLCGCADLSFLDGTDQAEKGAERDVAACQSRSDIRGTAPHLECRQEILKRRGVRNISIVTAVADKNH